MSFAIRLVPDTLRVVTYNNIGAQFYPFGPVLLHPMRIISIKNLTDQSVLISFDGINFHEIVPSESGIVWDFCTNRVSEAGAFIAAGTQIYVSDNAAAPTVGQVYMSCFYGFGE
jgi:hypothetical protein